MKSFVVVLAVASVVIISVQSASITPEQLEKLVTYSRDCRAQTGASIEQVTKAIAGEFEDDPKLKEQLFCISKKIGFQDESGEIKKDVLSQKINGIIKDASKTEEIIKHCAVKKATPQETAFYSMKCYSDERGINFLG